MGGVPNSPKWNECGQFLISVCCQGILAVKNDLVFFSLSPRVVPIYCQSGITVKQMRIINNKEKFHDEDSQIFVISPISQMGGHFLQTNKLRAGQD